MNRLSQFAAPVVFGLVVAVVGGCASKDHPEIPVTAREIGEARENVFWTAPYEGNVYVYDATENRLLYTGRLQRGQTVRVDAKEDKITVDEAVVTERDMIASNRFKIFFDRLEGEDVGTAARHQVNVRETETHVYTAPQQPAQQPAQQPMTGEQTTITAEPDGRTTVITPGQTTIRTDPEPAGATIEVETDVQRQRQD